MRGPDLRIALLRIGLGGLMAALGCASQSAQQVVSATAEPSPPMCN